MEREMICISCPIGCRLTVTWEDMEELSGDDISVEGNKCVRGEEYGKEDEHKGPREVTEETPVTAR